MSIILTFKLHFSSFLPQAGLDGQEKPNTRKLVSICTYQELTHYCSIKLHWNENVTVVEPDEDSTSKLTWLVTCTISDRLVTGLLTAYGKQKQKKFLGLLKSVRHHFGFSDHSMLVSHSSGDQKNFPLGIQFMSSPGPHTGSQTAAEACNRPASTSITCKQGCTHKWCSDKHYLNCCKIKSAAEWVIRIVNPAF